MYLKEKLKVLSDRLVEENYDLTLDFPKYETYALGDQIRRALISVASNLHEGFSQSTDRHRAKYCRISLGSLNELIFQMKLANRKHYISDEKHDDFVMTSSEVARLLSTLIKILEK